VYQRIDLEKIGGFKKNGSEKGFRMKKLWLFEKKLVDVAGKVRECAGMKKKNPPPQNGDLNPRPLLSKNSFEPIDLYKKFERERERERGGGLDLRACLEKALFPYKTQNTKPNTNMQKKKRTLRSRNLQGKFHRKNTKRTPLTTRSQINTPVFLTWLKPSECKEGNSPRPVPTWVLQAIY
jgi:hypothetical protein